MTTESNPVPNPGKSRLHLMSKALFAPFSHKKDDSTRILSDRQFTLLPCTHLTHFLSSRARHHDTEDHHSGRYRILPFAWRNHQHQE